MNIFTSSPIDKTPTLKAAVNILLLTAAFVLFFWFVLLQSGTTLEFDFVLHYRIRIVDGFLMTLSLSVLSLIASLVLGMLTAVMQSSSVLILRYMAKLYVTIIRGTPLIAQIYLFHYIVGTAFGLNNRFLSGVIILSLFEAAYISEIIRGSLLSMDETQLEAAKAVGFTPVQSFRHVLLPQMIARTLPALTGQFASIIKDSSLLSVIALSELTQTMREISAEHLNLFESNFLLALLYFALTLPISLLGKWVERRFSYENRA